MPTDIAVGHDTDPFVSAYPWTPSVGFGVKYADPATKPTGIGRGVAFCSSGGGTTPSLVRINFASVAARFGR